MLIAETDRQALRELDEDGSWSLHTRIRRARTKYVKLYRRQASARVDELGGRGFAVPKNQRNRDKAEVFEQALARVSRQVAAAAARAAEDLRAERLEAARGGGTGPQGDAPVTSAPAGRQRVHSKTTGGVKKDASSRAAGARRQGKRDGR